LGSKNTATAACAASLPAFVPAAVSGGSLGSARYVQFNESLRRQARRQSPPAAKKVSPQAEIIRSRGRRRSATDPCPRGERASTCEKLIWR